MFFCRLAAIRCQGYRSVRKQSEAEMLRCCWFSLAVVSSTASVDFCVLMRALWLIEWAESISPLVLPIRDNIGMGWWGGLKRALLSFLETWSVAFAKQLWHCSHLAPVSHVQRTFCGCLLLLVFYIALRISGIYSGGRFWNKFLNQEGWRNSETCFAVFFFPDCMKTLQSAYSGCSICMTVPKWQSGVRWAYIVMHMWKSKQGLWGVHMRKQVLMVQKGRIMIAHCRMVFALPHCLLHIACSRPQQAWD